MQGKLITKICTSCKRELPLNEFAPRRWRSNKPDAHFTFSTYGNCRICISKRKQSWRQANPDYMKHYRMKLKQVTV
jgi:hypothetical protein